MGFNFPLTLFPLDTPNTGFFGIIVRLLMLSIALVNRYR
jgi:hypothetical protein